MSDLDFRNFGTRSFEQFVQALAVRHVAKGITIFGDGPDGGREAAYEGPMDYPGGSRWNGYLVLQAKFLQKSERVDNAGWLVEQLRAELQKYRDPDRNLTRPQYYLIATNAQLSSISPRKSKRGKILKSGKDRIADVFSDFSDLGFRGFDVWDYDRICSYIDLYPELKRSYRAWITSSELLWEVLKDRERYSVGFEEVIWRLLSKEVRKQQFTKLQQAGHANDQGVPLHDVFIDLPFGGGEEFDQDEANSIGVLRHLLDQANQKLDPLALHERRRALQQAEGQTQLGNRFLVLGGPGQGKSTVTQFMAQVLRARWLQNEPEHRFAPGTYGIVRGVVAAAGREEVPIEGPARFPIRVDLPRFADHLLEAANNLSLLEYIRTHIGTCTEMPIQIADLRRWLTDHPWLLMLDGLDEVPASGNRATVLEKIDDFWDEVASLEADLMMIVMSRPQGYNSDLSPNQYQAIELTKLDRKVALRSATLLANSCIPELADRQRVLDIMAVAASNPTTERLLISPLQVAIMLALVESRGEAPTDRWQLFDGYYRVIGNRERAKHDGVARVLKERARDIDIIHQQAGILLQTESESSGTAEAQIGRQRLTQLVDGYLEANGQDVDTRQRLSKAIIDASMERLVFLNGRIQEQVSFDVRSLQEFMAAARIMNGPPDLVQARLRTIASKSHWLHVFQIAASKAFSVSDAQHFRDTIVQICLELNDDGPRHRIVGTGSRLALSLLEDGVAFDQPNYAKSLARTAMSALRHGVHEFGSSLVDVCARPDLADVVQASVEEGLRSADVELLRSSWIVCMRLVARHVGWAENLAAENWSGNAEVIQTVLAECKPSSVPRRIRDLVDDAVLSLPVDTILDVLSSAQNDISNDYQASYPFLKRLFSERSRRNDFPVLDSDSPLKCELRRVSNQRRETVTFPASDAYAPLRIIDAFWNAPSLSSLISASIALDMLPSRGNLGEITEFSPWPIYAARDLMDRKVIARWEELDEHLGDLDDWVAAENRFLKDGFSSSDLTHWTSGSFISDKCKKGFPKPNQLWLSAPDRRRSLKFLSDLIESVEHIVDAEPPVVYIRDMISFGLGEYSPRGRALGVEDINLVWAHPHGERGSMRINGLHAFPPLVLKTELVRREVRQSLTEGRYFFRTVSGRGIAVAEKLISAARHEKAYWVVAFLAAREDLKAMRAVASRVPTEFCVIVGDEPAIFQEASATFQLLSDQAIDVGLIHGALTSEGATGHGVSQLGRVVQHEEAGQDRLALLERVLSHPRYVDHQAQSLLRQSLRGALSKERSQLATAAKWSELGLEGYVFDVLLAA